ncbi:MAG TPA: hypothetical protein DC035_02320 [Lachnospiraceae bacterium]|nr:hypothetical protein [Lachnospiraceae bacterium]
MKRKRNQLFVTALTAAMAVSLLSPAEPAAAAKKVKFNVKKLSLTVGKKKTLKIKNVKKKAKWSIKSGKDKIKLQKKKKASVVVAAKKAGSAKVQAKVGKKKYVCKVVVKAKTVKNGTSAGTKTTNKPADAKKATKNPSNGQNNVATQPTNNPSNGQNNATTQPTNNPSKDNPSKDNPANPTATPAADPDVPKKNEQDVKKLQALIQTLNQKGADISANLDDESVYHWNKEGRLTEIYWGEKEIIGAEMADFNEFTALEILDINNNNISGTFYVGDLANLKELKCYGNKIDKLVLDTNKNLQELDCHNNQISNTIRLNDSKNLERLYCSNNKITELDVSGCDKLQDVDCSNNLMSSLNVSDLPSLKSLNCSRNMLKDDNLILTGSIGLINLDCSLNGTNYDFINLNLAGFTKLESLNCSEQPEDGGTSADDTMGFDISACTGLKTLNCSYCPIETLDVLNLSNLETIDASGCNLSEITLDGAVKLSSLNINCNEITDLHIPETNEIKILDCSESLGIETINFAVLTKLESLDVSDSYVPELDFSICPDLQVLNAMNTGFGNPDATTDNEDLPNIDIDLKSNAKLKDIDMSMVNVNVLTLPENDIVANLSASNSAVTQIVNLEKQLGLETLNIAGTGISALDLSANTNLKQVSCTESQKTGITGVDESIIYIVPDDSDDGEDGNEDGDDGEDGNEDGDVELE